MRLAPLDRTVVGHVVLRKGVSIAVLQFHTSGKGVKLVGRRSGCGLLVCELPFPDVWGLKNE